MVRSISLSFHDAKLCDPLTGNPTDDARSAYRWLMRDPASRYLTGQGTFATYCHSLGWEYLDIRKNGTPAGSYGWKEAIGGISAVKNAWAKNKFEWYISGGPQRLAGLEARERYERSLATSEKRGQGVILPEMLDWDRWLPAIGGLDGLVQWAERPRAR